MDIEPSIRDLEALADLCNILHGHFDEILPSISARCIALDFLKAGREVANFYVPDKEPTFVGIFPDLLPRNVCLATYCLFKEPGQYDGIEFGELVGPRKEWHEDIANRRLRELGERCQINSAKHSN